MADTALWNRRNLGYKASGHKRHFPTEYVLRSLLSPTYFQRHKPVEQGHSVLDIGCLYANNLVPFADRGCSLFGVEAAKDAVEVARESAARQGLDLHVEQGSNANLPFCDRMFDFVLSINTIHYEESKGAIIQGLEEMRRVLKPDGCLLASTAGQEHHFVSSAAKRGPNHYTVRREGDFRAGEIFSFLESREDFAQTLQAVFSHVETAVVTESYPKAKLQFYIGKCFIK